MYVVSDFAGILSDVRRVIDLFQTKVLRLPVSERRKVFCDEHSSRIRISIPLPYRLLLRWGVLSSAAAFKVESLLIFA